ncbi:MAG: DNA repair protein RecN [Nitrospinae bacterium CG11_big_fil_rev_8_21_14_0_20_45_15]|nr:MAG: DNA repair protein RecN [Nitrospinae bacterium CG11_big_fil_rev_8_21_14_0_20_45_15]
MLTLLQIENFAIIDKLSVEFAPGLNVLTGETGAGKSILLDALNLILGGRADYDCIRTGETSARVEACFQIKEKNFESILDELGIPSQEGELTIKRQLSTAGKGKCWINDSPVSVSALAQIGARLVDIHGQHDHQTLLHPENHLDLLDLYGKTMPKRERFGKEFHAWKSDLAERDRLLRQDQNQKEREELLTFQLQEIEQAGLEEGEEEALSAERNKLRHGEKLQSALDRVQEILSDADSAVLAQLGKAVRELEPLLDFDPALEPNLQSANNALYEVEGLCENLRDYARTIQSDPQRLEEIEDRMAELNGLKRKYGGDITAIFERKKQIEFELESLSTSHETLARLKVSIQKRLAVLQELAIELAKEREATALRLKENIEKELRDLNMNAVQFGARFDYEADADSGIVHNGEAVKFGPLGIGAMEFLFSSNLGEDLRPLAKIASGGEISRVMLAIKTILNKQDDVPVMIFDEVDTGIGGKTAEKVGAKLKKLAEDKQVFCVSHLPQIAGMASAHFSVRKEVKGKRTRSNILRLSDEERIEEIAHMSAGEKVTPAAREYARQLIISS